MTGGAKRGLRALAAMLALAGCAFGWRHFHRNHEEADVPTASAKQGEFLVLVRCRGELTTRRSVQITAPLDVPDLQVVFLSPPGREVKAGQTVIKFDPTRSQQDL